MHRVSVNSQSVASIGYDPSEFVLEIEFHNGQVYRYIDVPAAAHRLLMQAPSIGAFVNTVIKPKFDAVRI